MTAIAAEAPPPGLRARFRHWWQSRLPASDTLVLGQRNVYILPTPAGLMFAATLVVLLLASINYQLNLGYVLTFLLAGSGVVSMHVTHATLRGLTLRLRAPAPVFAGEPALLDVVLASPDRARFGIGLKLHDAPAATLGWVDVPAQGQASAQSSFVPAARGLHALPALSVETRFPLGLFRAWAIWRPAAQLLVYPAPERPAAPLPPARAVAAGTARARAADGGEVEGVRAYRRGDPLNRVYWKKAAKAMASGGELASRDTAGAVQQQLWLDWQGCAALAPEQRLARLAAWVLAAQRAGAEYGLGLPGARIEAGQGEAQRRRCLEALALWR
ncbi:DUF58 domain-containing protein [Piscinibacter sp.]|uniref:DUF58 domain-containing protein n=1 Tax=Piscinibacter sp. TaxID=1903157 RepID=UPI0039E5B7B8